MSKGKTFKDKFKDVLYVSRVRNEVEISAYEAYHAPTILYFAAEEARKIGKELIKLADEIKEFEKE